MRIADIAQSVEHSLGKGEVTSSNLVIGTTLALVVGVNGVKCLLSMIDNVTVSFISEIFRYV